jgi:hypothetical protein
MITNINFKIVKKIFQDNLIYARFSSDYSVSVKIFINHKAYRKNLPYAQKCLLQVYISLYGIYSFFV